MYANIVKQADSLANIVVGRQREGIVVNRPAKKFTLDPCQCYVRLDKSLKRYIVQGQGRQGCGLRNFFCILAQISLDLHEFIVGNLKQRCQPGKAALYCYWNLDRTLVAQVMLYFRPSVLE